MRNNQKYTAQIRVDLDLADEAYHPTIDEAQQWAKENLKNWLNEGDRIIGKIELSDGALTFLETTDFENWEEKEYPPDMIPLVLPTWGIFDK